MHKYNLIIDNNKFNMNLIWKIFTLRKEFPEAFYERINKISLYFMFPYSIWSKSVSNRLFNPYENVEADLNSLQDQDCNIYFEFENTDLYPETFNDRYSNMVLEASKDKNVFAVVFNDELAKYIKGKYPYVKLVQSEIKRAPVIEPPYEFNVIDSISYSNNKDRISDKQNYILLLNSFCNNLYRCSNMLSNNKLNFGTERPINCGSRIKTFEEVKKSKLFVSTDELNKLNDEGIENFMVKTNGDEKFEVLEAILYYLIKPEFLDIIRLKIIKEEFVNR